MIQNARQFAMEKHQGQVRKYTSEPYFNHLQEVANIVSEYTDDQEMIAAAYLHDVLEDTDAHPIEIIDGFGVPVFALVHWLTDVSKPHNGNRANRKRLDREHTLAAPSRAQIIKCADLISNTSSITAHEPNFAKVYLEEKRLLLAGMREEVKSHPIWERAKSLI